MPLSDPGYYALQQDRVFSRSWQYATDSARVKAPGHVLPFTLLDGVCVIDADKAMLRERLARYLSSDVPLKACRHCLGTSGRWEPCEQLAVDEARSRNAANAVPARALLVSPVEAALRARTTNWRAGPASWATIVKPKARP